MNEQITPFDPELAKSITTTGQALIKKLANQAGCDYLYDYSADGHAMVCNVDDIEKFAELIVKECARTVNDTEYPYEDTSHKDTWDACCVWSAEKLKEHFGVE